ncbi:MAG: DegV family protein [Candidatus Pacebacteria bacterium]|nr:DegV family protein [Candidatus Paceibacterota bacterium]
MEKIGLVAEDVIDMPQELIEKYQISLAKMKFSWPEIENFPGENNFQKMREAEKRGERSFGKTSQPSMGDFLEKYKLQLSKFDEVICLAATSKLSGSFNSATQAKRFLKPEEQNRVFVIDSQSVAGGQALLVLKAIDLINDGKSAKDIVKELEDFVPQVSLFLILKDPKWVEASGRLSHLAANLIRGLAKAGIRPIMAIKNGVLGPAGIRTNAKDIPTALFNQFEHDTEKLQKEGKRFRVVINHGDDLAGAQRLKEMIEGKFANTKVVFVHILDNVLGVLAGPDALAISWLQE